MTDDRELEAARRRSGLAISDLWLRFFALGGMSSPLEMEAIVFGALMPDPFDRELIILALNERFAELGARYRLPYSDE